jgi:hypothetical protein
MVFVLQTLFAWTSGMALNCTKRSVAWCSTGEIIDTQVLKIKTGSKEAKCLALSNFTKGLALRKCSDKYLFVCEVRAKIHPPRKHIMKKPRLI